MSTGKSGPELCSSDVCSSDDVVVGQGPQLNSGGTQSSSRFYSDWGRGEAWAWSSRQVGKEAAQPRVPSGNQRD